jgi:glycosyltransferase involved in cell wall biosynthesis
VTAAWLGGAHRQSAFVISRRVGYPLGKSRLALDRYRAATRIVAISQWVVERLVESGAPQDKIAVVYEGVEMPQTLTIEMRQRARRRLRIPDDAILLGSVGVLSPDKGHELLIRALAQVRTEFPECRLLLAGDGPSRLQLETLAKELGVAEKVIFAGFVTEIDSVYQALDVFLFPSSFEGLGTSLLSAMSYEVPSVTFQCCAFGEIIENDKSGLLVELGNVAEISQAVIRLLRDKEFARSIGQAGRARIAEKFSSTRMVAEMTKVYRDVLPPSLDETVL